MISLKKAWLVPATATMGLALLFMAGTAWAQEDDPPHHPNPDARAARLSFVEGSVSLTQGNAIIADPALVNTPVFEGMAITTREDGKAELQFDDGTVARLSPNSSLKIGELKQDGGTAKAELVLVSGLGYFELPGNTESGRMTVRFGDSAVSASGFTVIRVNLDNPPGELAVFNGNAHLERGNYLSLDLHGGENVALNGTDPNQYNLAETIEPDSWDAWNADRDQDLTTQEAAKTAATGSQPNSSNPAWGDLDTNGNWYNVPGEGYVWSPYQAEDASWDPYGCGNWVWTPQFGYVWVSCESWGYLPYTSGYWNYYDGFGWGWAPGYGYPWWFTGGWGWNIGKRPPRYNPPHRPHGGPVHPVQPIRRGGLFQPNPPIAVNRIPHPPVANPVHVVGRPVTISGSTVEPMKPLMPRPVYGHVPAVGGSGRALLGTTGNGANGSTTGYNPWANSPGLERERGWTRPTGGGGYHPPADGGYHPGNVNPSPGGTYRGPIASPYSGGMRPSAPSAPVAAPRAPVATPRASGGGSAPHMNSGGGGGGHASSGGGGGGGSHAGGGGASHK